MSGSQIPLPMPYNTGHHLLRAGCSALRAGKHGDPLSIETGRVYLSDLSQSGKGFILQPSHIPGERLENTHSIALRTIRSALGAYHTFVKSTVGIDKRCIAFCYGKSPRMPASSHSCKAVAIMHHRLNRVTDMHRIYADPSPIIPPSGRPRVWPADEERCKACCRTLTEHLFWEISEDNVR